MPKGLFTASVAALFPALPPLDALERVLSEAGFPVRGRAEASGDNPWLGGPSLLVEMRPEINGLVTIDQVGQPWPDGMGHPTDVPDIFTAWSFGAFGPFVFPKNLERAAEHAIRWPEAGKHIGQHGAFVRARASYVFGKTEDSPVLPDGYDAAAELRFLTDVARSIMTLPDAIAFFSPSGEVLLDRERLETTLEERDAESLLPLDLWSNIRFFRIGDAKGWAVMDTVGMEQLGVPDQEACFALESVDADSVASFLRELSLFLMGEDVEVGDGDTIEGPGGVWRARHHEASLVAAPRPTLRWLPTFGPPPAPELG